MTKKLPPHDLFYATAVRGQLEYDLPKYVTGIFLVTINGKPVNFDVVLRLKRHTREDGDINIGVLRKPLDK